MKGLPLEMNPEVVQFIEESGGHYGRSSANEEKCVLRPVVHRGPPRSGGVSLETTSSLQIAKENGCGKLESALFRGDSSPLPTKTPLERCLNEYVEYMASFKTAKSVQTDVYYLRAMFGEVCQALTITARRRSPRAQKRPEIKAGQAGQGSR